MRTSQCSNGLRLPLATQQHTFFFSKRVVFELMDLLLERPVPDARAPFVLPEYLKMALSKNIMRNVARFRIRGHGLKCETGLYDRSPDRSARVCNLCENGDYI